MAAEATALGRASPACRTLCSINDAEISTLILPPRCDTIFSDRHGIWAVSAAGRELKVEGVKMGAASRITWRPGTGKTGIPETENGLPYPMGSQGAAEVRGGKGITYGGNAAKEAVGAGTSDTVAFGAEDRGPVSEEAVLDYLRVLEKDYPGVTILIRDREEVRDIKQLAASLGKGRFLVVTTDFLKRMGRDAGEYERCKTVLKETVRGLALGGSANASEGACLDTAGKKTWAAPASGKQKLESEINVKKASVSSYATSGHYGSLARAGTKGQVQKVLGDVHRSIGNLRLAACFGDEEERTKADRAIRSLQKLLARGSRKIRRLDRESSLKLQMKHAEKARKEKKVLQIRLEMKKRRAARYGGDYSLVREGLADTCYILGTGKHRRREEERAAQELPGTGGIGGGIGSMGGDGGGEGSIDASDVVISDGGSF